jgi:hypothetical protein
MMGGDRLSAVAAADGGQVELDIRKARVCSTFREKWNKDRGPV